MLSIALYTVMQSIAVLSVLLSVVMLGVVMLSNVNLSIVMLSVLCQELDSVSPFWSLQIFTSPFEYNKTAYYDTNNQCLLRDRFVTQLC